MPFLSFFLITVLTVVHPLHISVTEISLDEKENELESMIRVFTDDLEQAIRSERKNPDLNLWKCEALLSLGRNTGQGYYFSRPVPAAQLDAWMTERRVTLV